MESLLTLEESDVLEMGLPKALVKMMFKKAGSISSSSSTPRPQEVSMQDSTLPESGQTDEYDTVPRYPMDHIHANFLLIFMPHFYLLAPVLFSVRAYLLSAKCTVTRNISLAIIIYIHQ